MATVTPITTLPKIRVNDGTTTTGAQKYKVMAFGPNASWKAGWTSAQYDAMLTQANLARAILVKTINAVRVVETSEISE